MGRFSRHRSSSGASYSEMKQQQLQSQSSASDKNDAAATELLHVVLSLVDSTTGKHFLHCLGEKTCPTSLNMAHALMQRAYALQLNDEEDETDDRTSILQSLLQQADVESGYIPLHWAIKNANLAAVLLLLRRLDKRFTRRPMDLLANVSIQDKEGLTPLHLLAMLQQTPLRECRQDLMATRTTYRTNPLHRRAPVMDADDDQEELALLSANLHLLQQASQQGEGSVAAALSTTTGSIISSACEVITFGRAHHVALGVDSSSGTTHPKRVREFGLDVRQDNDQGSAVVVAAATHHSLVVTSNGGLYSCGLGKGGRLGQGTEQQTSLLFRKVSLKPFVVHASAAENHSLCVTEDGRVYAFGSNRFGQLFGSASRENQCYTPRRVDDLRHVHVVQVAAGDKHSVALTKEGQVYTWGDNQNGQLGVRSVTGKAQVVTALWNASPPKVATAICASEHSSLVITKPTAAPSLPVNSVYQWGHGNPLPIKVNFSAAQHPVNPVDIACAKYHNAAITKDGLVYTWGLHAEPLGNTCSSPQQSSMVIASPQLVEGMLPENGGGIAVAVSAAATHTAVVTVCGKLYTWGGTYGKNVLGHEGVSWQQTPKRVEGVHRAVSIAAAKEHNVVLMATNFPQGPPSGKCTSAFSSLEELAAREVAKHVDLFNVIPILITAERVECTILKDYCYEFVRLNLDGVLCLSRKSDMDCFLNEQLAAGFDVMERDAECHPLIYDVVMAGMSSSVGAFDSAAWMHACKSLLERLPLSTLVKYRASACKGMSGGEITTRALRRTRTLSFHDSDDTGEQRPGECSERCIMLTANMDVSTCDAAQSKVAILSKEVRTVKKRLNQIAKLQLAESLTPEQHQKVQRKTLLESDLAVLEPALVSVEARLRELQVEQDVPLPRSTESDKNGDAVKEWVTPESGDNITDTSDAPEKDAVEAKTDVEDFRCDLCSVKCPDAKSLAMHMNGRKHRNRVVQAEEEEQNKVASLILEEKRRQSMLSDDGRPSVPAIGGKKMSAWGKPASQTVLPRYRLPPPPHFPTLKEATSTDLPTKMTSKTALNASSIPIAKSVPKKYPLNGATELNSKEHIKSRPGSHLSPGHIPALVSPPWASPVAKLPDTSASDVSSSNRLRHAKEEKRTLCSLGDFLLSSSPSKERSISAPWSPPNGGAATTSTSSKSFVDIQQEEQESRDKEHTRVHGKWYIGQRVRAGSISAIQEAEERDREQRLLVEEQKQIEAQIERELRQAQRKSHKGKARARKKKAAKTSSAGDEKRVPNRGTGRKQRSDARKKNYPKERPSSSI